MSQDLKLQQRVLAELRFDPSIEAAHVGVTVRDGVVTLTGRVASDREKSAAEQATRRVKDVSAVAQEIEVRLPSDGKMADDEIAQRALTLMHRDMGLPPGAVQLKVERGAVTLSGTLERGFQDAELETQMREIGGVREVINTIAVRARVEARDVRARIRGAFERVAELEASHLTVEVSEGKVRLGGLVKNWNEREVATGAAWSTPGVVAVEDNILIAHS